MLTDLPTRRFVTMPNSLNDRFPHSTSKLARILADLTGFQSLEPSTEPEDWRDARYIIVPEGLHYCDHSKLYDWRDARYIESLSCYEATLQVLTIRRCAAGFSLPCK